MQTSLTIRLEFNIKLAPALDLVFRFQTIFSCNIIYLWNYSRLFCTLIHLLDRWFVKSTFILVMILHVIYSIVAKFTKYIHKMLKNFHFTFEQY